MNKQSQSMGFGKAEGEVYSLSLAVISLVPRNECQANIIFTLPHFGLCHPQCGQWRRVLASATPRRSAVIEARGQTRTLRCCALSRYTLMGLPLGRHPGRADRRCRRDRHAAERLPERLVAAQECQRGTLPGGAAGHRIAGLPGIGLGPVLVALVTDRVFHDDSALPYAISSVVLPTALMAIWLCWSGLKPYALTSQSLHEQDART